jgi:hypothetical protein
VVMYVLGTPGRRRARLAAERSAMVAAPDDGGHPTGDAVAPERKES